MESILQGGGIQASDRENRSFRETLERESDFRIRRAVERLREGLFDPVAVRLLTAHENRLREETERGFRAVDAGKSPHLCVVGAYGQGKSHSLTYIQDRASREGFVTSMVNLDPREVPFQNFREVYRALTAGLRFPDTEASFIVQWKRWAQQQMAESQDPVNAPADVLPKEMPHLFKSVLVAMAHRNLPLSEKEKRLKKHAAFRPKEFPVLLARALAGETVPYHRLRNVFKYRRVPFFKEAPLTLCGTEPFFQMTRSLGRLLRNMGYRGWVLLFDEGESIVQANVLLRSKAYKLLHRFFSPEEPDPSFLYPVFAFTEDFFHQVRQEDYDQVRVRGEVEIPYFDRNYAQEWRDLTVYRLSDLSREEWEDLSRKLMDLHARAYRWQPPEAEVHREMANRLSTMSRQETRLKLKALVDCLDLAYQEQVL